MTDPDYALFARVIESGSLSAAGRTMGLSPAMVSKRLARLEARLGVHLVHRTTRRLALTPAGQGFHADVVAILRAIGEAEARLTGIRDEPAGPLRVSAPTSFGRLHIAPRLPDYLAAHPRVALELDLTDANADLLGGHVDVAVRITAQVPPGVVAHRLADNRRILCASPAYVARHGMPGTIAALGRHRLLAATGQMPWRLTHATRRQVIDGPSAIRTNSSEIVRELAIGGVGIALRSLWDVGDALETGRLIRVLPGWEGPRDLAIHALHPRVPMVTPAVRSFVEFLRRGLAPPPWREDFDGDA